MIGCYVIFFSSTKQGESAWSADDAMLPPRG